MALTIRAPSDTPVTAGLWPLDGGGWVVQQELAFSFTVPAGKSQYLSTGGHTNFGRGPDRVPFPLEPDTTYTLEAQVSLDGGEAVLWLIEYGPEGRLDHQRRLLTSGHFCLSWRTALTLVSWCMAIRFAGSGRLTIHDASLRSGAVGLGLQRPMAQPAGGESSSALRNPHCDKHWSIFFDPGRQRTYTPRHHQFYDDWKPAWYEGARRAVAGRRRVLDLGCGRDIARYPTAVGLPGDARARTRSGIPRAMS